MRKKIMIAVDQSLHARNAMKYAVQMAEFIKKVNFALYHIQPMVSQYLTEETHKRPKAKAELEQLKMKNKTASNKLLEECKSYMVGRGIDFDCIEIKTIILIAAGSLINPYI